MKKRILTIIAVIWAVMAAWPGCARGEGSGRGSILVISDTHLTEEMRDSPVLDAVIRAARGRDAVLLLGDSTNNSHGEEHALVLRWAEEIRHKTGAEVYIIPGNHDYSAQMGPEEFRDKYGEYGWNRAFLRDGASAGCAVMTGFGACLILLDTNDTGAGRVKADGGITQSDLNWLKHVLEALPDGTPVIACGHHPILPPERNSRTPGADALCSLLRGWGVSLYLCGHDHGFFTSEKDGLRQITVGQPQAFPGWAGVLEMEKDQFAWHTEPLFDDASPYYLALKENAYALARVMAQGALMGTPYADDGDAVSWFADAYMLFAGGEMTEESCDALLHDENCQKWREAETRTVVKEWMLNLLENCPEDVRRITVPVRGVPSAQRGSFWLPADSSQLRLRRGAERPQCGIK